MKLQFSVNILPGTYFQGPTVANVHLCDSILDEHAQILSLVCKLEAQASSESGTFINEKLNFLIGHIVHLRPEFTAANFFSLDKTTLFSILYSITTFLVVIIQYTFYV
jgi:gustatory receptor